MTLLLWCGAGLNASVAAALTMHTVLLLYGARACGDFAREAPREEVKSTHTSPLPSPP